MKTLRRVVEPEEYLKRIEMKHRDDNAPKSTEVIVDQKQKGVSKAMRSLISNFNKGR